MIALVVILAYVLAGAFSGLGQKTTAEALAHAWGKKTATKPTKIYLTLTSVVPTATSKGSTLTELTGATGIARIEVPAASIEEATEGSPSFIQTSAELVSGAITAGSGTAIGWALVADAAAIGEEGVIKSWGTCTSVVISSTQQPWKVAAKGLKAELTS